MASARTRLRAFFLKNVGRVIGWEELRDASGGITEWARRVRELRQDEGYKILTHNDRADLKPGQYLLVDPKPEPAFERNISKETRAIVLDRNGYTCQMCGAAAGEPSARWLGAACRRAGCAPGGPGCRLPVAPDHQGW